MNRFWVALVAAAIPLMAHAESANTLRICTGVPTGNYQWAAEQIQRHLPNNLFQRVVLVPTSGSLMNLQKLAQKDCDVGFAQDDVVGRSINRSKLTILKLLYQEYTHILCPVASGWRSLSDFASAPGQRRLIVGAEGSGSAETWRMIRSVNNQYDSIEQLHEPVDITSATQVMESTNICMLWVSGLNSDEMLVANQLSVLKSRSPALRLLTIDDPALYQLVGTNGTILYSRKTIVPSPEDQGHWGLYDHLIQAEWFRKRSIDVLTISAYLVIRSDYRAAIGPQREQRLLQAIATAQTEILARVNPPQ